MSLGKSFWTIQSLLLAIAFLSFSADASVRKGWLGKDVDLLAPGNGRIKEIYYPADKEPPLFSEGYNQGLLRRERVFGKRQRDEAGVSSEAEGVICGVIDSPPIDGFVPWIVVLPTDDSLGIYELDAIPEVSISSSYLTSSPERDYIVGLFDTGASAHVMGYWAALNSGVFSEGLVTSAVIELLGANSSIEAFVSHPLGLFIDGLGALEPNSVSDESMLLMDRSNMIGESNISIVVGQPVEPNEMDLPTVIGSPLSVYFTATINNETTVTVINNGVEYTAPDMRFYDPLDPSIPSYLNTIPLQLRPTDGFAVQYFPCIEPIYDCPDGDGSPITPSVITGLLPTQSLFFVPSGVDLYNETHSAIDKTGFMFDTGAQITVISTTISTRLGLSLGNPDFEVPILDVTGTTTIRPGFYLDRLEIPGTEEWLSYTNVPVVVLDVLSPEGGYLDGIIGMNLFISYNMVFRGDWVGPSLEVEYIEPSNIVADIAPDGGDGAVNSLDLLMLADCWLGSFPPASVNWDEDCDIAPEGEGDNKIDILDFALMAEHWLEGI